VKRSLARQLRWATRAQISGSLVLPSVTRNPHARAIRPRHHVPIGACHIRSIDTLADSFAVRAAEQHLRENFDPLPAQKIGNGRWHVPSADDHKQEERDHPSDREKNGVSKQWGEEKQEQTEYQRAAAKQRVVELGN
jgi:hypothetical protein